MDTFIIESYRCLVADVAELTGVPLKGVQDDSVLNWVLKDAPAIDKGLLVALELLPESKSVAIQVLRDIEAMFPMELRPLMTELAQVCEDCEPTDILIGFYLRHLRQLLLFCYKAELPHDKCKTEETIEGFLETDRSIGCWNRYFAYHCEQPLSSAYYRAARRYVAKVIGNIDWSDIQPAHGPGAVFPTRDPSRKANWMTIYPSIQQYYPYDTYYRVQPGEVSDLEVSEESTETIRARITAVPKDTRGPRLICVHPAEAIWVQQGQRRLLERAIETNIKGIRFNNQKLNMLGALTASVDRYYTTLDLREASDRISCELIKFLFGEYTYAILSCARAEEVVVGKTSHRLNKWAPMGNCLTFPVQSLVFWALVRASIWDRCGVICNDIRVFGDDLIFPSKYHDAVVTGLTRAGLIVNSGKTFHKGFFRESCGVDAYAGVVVTPVRMKKVDRSPSGLVALCDLAKRLRRVQYERTSQYVYSYVGRELHHNTSSFGRLRKWSFLSKTNDWCSSGLVEWSPESAATLLQQTYVRWNEKLHRWEVPTHQLRPALEHAPTGHWCGLLDSLSRLERSLAGSTKFVGYTVPHRERLQRGWTELVLSDKPTITVNLACEVLETARTHPKLMVYDVFTNIENRDWLECAWSSLDDVN